MSAWEPEEDITVGKRRRRPKRRMDERRVWPIALGVVVLLGLAGGGYYVYRQSQPATGGLSSLPNPAVVAPGPFRTNVGEARTITVGLEVRSIANEPVTLVGARIVPPAGLKAVALTILPAGPDNEGFKLTGDLPPATAVTLNKDGVAVVAARYTVSCSALLASAEPLDERIFVTIRVGTEEREDELTTPVVGTDDEAVPWLTATATAACNPTDTPGSPDPATSGG